MGLFESIMNLSSNIKDLQVFFLTYFVEIGDVFQACRLFNISSHKINTPFVVFIRV